MNRGMARLGWVTAVVVSAGLARAAVQAPWVSTDRTVDCTSFETIARDLKISSLKTDEDKALAMYYFFRQRVFHFQNTPESRDPIKNINAIGYTLCGSQATCMKAFLTSIGLKARVRTNIGHTYYDVFYDGQWHGFDTFANYFVYTRGPKRTIASFEEVIADPTLIKDAVKEGRACPNMGPCGDDAMQFAQTRDGECDYQPADTKYSPRDLSLRPGEEIVKTWWTDRKGVMALTNPQFGPVPLHTCGSKDNRAEPWLFKFWEPYGVPKLAHTSISYRHATGGQINYAPDLTRAKALEGLSMTGVSPTADGLAGAGEVVIPVNSPHYINGGALVMEATCPGPGDEVSVSLARTEGQWEPPALVAAEPGHKSYKVRFDASLSDGIRQRYWVKLGIAGKAAVNHLYLRTGFQYNAMSAPHLMPGKNTVTFEVANPEALQETPVTLVYRYREAPGWSEERRIERTVSKSPFTFEVKLPDTGDKLPQMLDMTWTCGKLAWSPASARNDRMLMDFVKPEAVKNWNADPAIALSHDGKGMLVTMGKSADGQQIKADVSEDWSGYSDVVVEFENLGSQEQVVYFRVRSDLENKERIDLEHKALPGKSTFRVPVSALAGKVKVKQVNRVYFLFAGIPDGGARIRVNSIVLEEPRDL